MELWYTEKQTINHGITTKVVNCLHHEQTEFQTIDLLETLEFGRMLVLDGMVMMTEADEFVYHEMIAHVPLSAHKNPNNVLVIGGGDGGVVREILRHGEKIQRVDLVEVDKRVIDLSKKYFPEVTSGLSDHRVNIHVQDGAQYIANTKIKYDVIIVDSTEPVGAATPLFQLDFYRAVFNALSPTGIMVAQTDTPWFKPNLVRKLYGTISSLFPISRLYTAAIPTYPSGLWSFTLGSKQYDPLYFEALPELKTKYYCMEVHRAAFNLPAFVQKLIKKKDELNE
ncbi:MAG: hypothetical protein RLZ12_864 [Bacillota bacterium]|jgi:spermidine synthase